MKTLSFGCAGCAGIGSASNNAQRSSLIRVIGDPAKTVAQPAMVALFEWKPLCY
jgi:hypothetical protein